MSIIKDILDKNHQTKLFDTNKIPDKEISEKIIKTAFELTASKQNLYPYKVHVLGPNAEQEKQDLYDIISYQKGGSTNVNVKEAPYCLIFTIRLITNPDPIILARVKNGHSYAAIDPKKYRGQIPGVALEVGMFSKVLSSLALENGLNVAYTGCFPNYEHNTNLWKKLSFIDDLVIFAMQFGYSLTKHSTKKEIEKKPHIDEVINWI
tara:strand:+ start:1053 stop:1673 length:621 start_codon:yes stop_codon:yes gene_type:complete